MKNIVFSVLFLILACDVHSQLVVDGEIRPRSEFRNGYSNTLNLPGESPEFLTSQRTMVGILYNEARVKGYVSVQDVRTWGESQVKKDSATLHLKQAWIEFPVTGFVRIKVGRQVLKYDNQRILAATNWNQIGSQHDVLKIQLEKDQLTAHFGLAYNNEASGKYFESYYPVPYYKMLQYLWLHYNFSEFFQTSLLSVVDVNAEPNTTDNYFARITYGGTLFYKPLEQIAFNATLYLQNGKDPIGTLVNAYMIALRSDYKLSSNINLFVGADVYSGHDPGNQPNKSKLFDRLYGAKHGCLGYMDYFPDSKSGVFDIYGGVKYKANKKWDMNAALYTFMLPHEYTNPDTDNKLDSFLGLETDFWGGYQIASPLKLSVIFGVMFGSESLEVVKGGNSDELNNFFSVMLTYKPRFQLLKSNEEYK